MTWFTQNANPTPEEQAALDHLEKTLSPPAQFSRQAKMMAKVKGKSKKRKTVAALLIEIAQEHYRIVVDITGTAYAIPKSGGHVAAPLSGKGGVLSKRLMRTFFEKYGTPPNPAAMQQAVGYLEALAMDDERVEVHLRSARTQDGLAIDLGDEAGRLVVVEEGKWKLQRNPPDGVLFRRTRLTGPLPKPSVSGDLNVLRDLLHVSDGAWDLIRAWLVMAWLPDVPVPILSITGTQGAGKSMLGRMLVSIVDPSAAPLKSPPKDAADWHTIASACRVVGVDNISRISEWWSDELCRTVTRQGSAKRQLYTDDDLIVTNFQRAVLLTSIDPGALRGDLAERLLPIELRSLRRRRSEEALQREFRRKLPRILGGLLDLVAEVLANPVDPPRLPRMADAARVMASVDAAVGSQALEAYRRAQDGLTETVLEGDPVAGALFGLLASHNGEWTGTPTALLGDLVVHSSDNRRNWPANARALSARLRRLRPALQDARGITIKTVRTQGGREVRINSPNSSKSTARIKGYAG